MSFYLNEALYFLRIRYISNGCHLNQVRSAFFLGNMKNSYLFRLFAVLLFLAVLPLHSLAAQTAKPMATTTLTFSSYRISNGDDTLDGSGLKIGVVIPFHEGWGFYSAASVGQAEGTHKNDDGTESKLEADTTSFAAGISWTSNHRSIRPYFQVGPLFQRYTYKFEYAGSETGSTSGTSLGFTVGTGVEFQLSNTFTLIPGYAYSSVEYQTESGTTKTMTSGGMTLALVAGF